MAESKHTPGPWRIIAVEDMPGNYLLANHEQRFTADYDEGNRNSSFEEEAANARLIAAAPDLLEALQRFMRYATNGEMGEMNQAAKYLLENTVFGDMLRAAIAKATGQE